MIDVFEEVGYSVKYKVLNSLNYSVAQKRERIVIIGVRFDIKDKIGSDYEYPKPLKTKLVLKDVLKNVPNSLCGTYSEKKKEVLKLVPAGGCWRDLPENVAKEYMGKSYYLGGGKTGMARKLSWDEPALTVLCSPSQKQTERCHPDEIRPFSIRENARIQSFPDDWKFEGPISEQYKQIGNAVPVEFAKHIGISIKEYLNKLNGKSMKQYSLSFISDIDLFNHVKETIEKYRFTINLQEFNKNLIDPIKLTFDSKVYGKTIEEIIESEIIRQIDKSNTNHIGYFHQNIFKYIGKNWSVPDKGFDVINEKDKFYVEMKNKHNTMNSSSSQKTYMRMQNQILKDSKSTCMLVEVIAKNSQNIIWNVSLDSESMSDNRIRRVSIDKFYEIVTGKKEAFKELIEVLPKVMDDVLSDIEQGQIESSVISELKDISPNILKSLYLLSFKNYEGFSNLKI